MSTTPNLDLPEMPANTFQPSVVYNEAMQRLDAIVVLDIQDIGLTTPPTTVSGDEGKRWIVKTGATGAWAGQTNNIALCTAPGLWFFIQPDFNWRGWVRANNAVAVNKYYRYTGTAWTDDSAAGAVSEAPVDGTKYVRKDAAWVSETAQNAAAVPYSNTTSGLAATNVQAAIDELVAHPPSPLQSIVVACSDETTALTTGTNKITFRNPYASAFTITHVKASLTTAQTGGSILTVDINESGVTILSTKLTIDNTEKTSETAATPPVVSDASIAADAEITVDIDQVGDGTAKGLKIYLIGHL